MQVVCCPYGHDRGGCGTLRAEMAARRITYRQLAERAGVPERTLARVLKPERDIKIDTLVALTKALGIPLVVFIGQAEQLRDRL